MKNIVTTLLLGTAVNATNLRNLAAGEWIPDICADEGVECALQDDGFWHMDKDGNWNHYEYASREVDGKEQGGYEVQDRTGTWTFIPFEKREGDGGYWIDDMEGQWKFRPYDKKHDDEGGFGYWIESFDGEYTFVAYEKEQDVGGYWITQLEGKRVYYPNPVVEVNDEEEFAKFDPQAASQEAVNDAAAKAEAELAGKIVGVAEDGRRRDQLAEVDTTDQNNQDNTMTEEQAQDYYINETISIGDYAFDIKLANAVNIAASAMAVATLFLAQI